MASRDRDDAITGLLRRNLVGGAGSGAGDECPAPDILAAYFERSLDAEETARHELHFSQCAHCRAQLAALARASEVPPKIETARQPAAFWLWNLAWLAPAAAVLLFAVVWFARQPLATRTPEPPLVARSRPEKSPTQEPLPQASPSIQNAPPQLTERAPAPSAPPPAKPAATSTATLDAIQTENLAKAQNLRAKRIDAAPQSANAPKDESADNVNRAALPASSSETVTVQSAAPAMAPSARPSSPAPSVSGGAQAGAVGGVAGGALSAQIVPLPESPGAMKKQEEGTRNLVQQAQTQSLHQSRAIALAADKEASAVIHTPDAKVLWRIASGGFVERSKDGGATWQGQLPNSNAHLVAGSAPGPNICWFVGDDGIILLTQDASNWQTVRPPLRADFTAITAQDASSATVTAADGRKFTTADRGKTWNSVP